MQISKSRKYKFLNKIIIFNLFVSDLYLGVIKMNFNGECIKEYENIIKNTSLQRGYQEFLKFFRYLKIYLEKEMPEYKFTGNIVENNMDYSYFQFSNETLKSKGLKIVVVFVHKTCNYEVWLSGINRNVQIKYHKELIDSDNKYTLTTDPTRLDYILKHIIISDCDYSNIDRLLNEIKSETLNFIEDIQSLV